MDRISRTLVREIDRFGASLIGCAAISPIVAALIAVATYDGSGGLGAVLGAVVQLVIAWLILSSAYFLLGLSKPEAANPTSYNLLRSRLDGLKAPQRTNAQHGSVSEEFRKQVSFIEAALDDRGRTETRLGRVQWVLGHAYTALWRRLHRAEEELIALAPRAKVAEYAKQAERSITSSQTDASTAAKMQKGLDDAFKVLGPAAVPPEPPPPVATAPALTEEGARTRVQHIWREIHEFRDDRWAQLLNARNQLLLTMGVSGIVFYTALLLAMVVKADVSTVRNAAGVFLVGAVVGLLARLNTQTQTSSVSDDYGLAIARLIVTPQLSGIAAVIGIAIVAATAPGQATVDLANSFDVQKVPNLLLAAAFGLTPGLVLERIRQDHERIAKEVKSTQPGEPSSATL